MENDYYEQHGSPFNLLGGLSDMRFALLYFCKNKPLERCRKLPADGGISDGTDGHDLVYRLAFEKHTFPDVHCPHIDLFKRRTQRTSAANTKMGLRFKTDFFCSAGKVA